MDLLYHGDTTVRSPKLTLPHPRMASRRFVLEPLAELRPEASLRGLDGTVKELLQRVIGRVSTEQVRTWKGVEAPFLAVTAYDYPTARLLDEAGADILHVGDTLGMVVLGYPDTTWVTMEEMEHHVAAVARGRRRALVTADLVAGSYDTPEQAVESSWRLMDAGADAVKLEGGREIGDQIRAVLEAGIPVQGHLGLLPQKAALTGGYRRHGRDDEEVRRLMEDAVALDALGCFSCVLECVVPQVARALTQAVRMPTVGIASGAVCDGEIRVIHDLLGAFPWYQPSYVKPLDTFGERTRDAVRRLREQLRMERLPAGSP
jgi:3-methyl-2-oxobutanoate hydroxymethyltransferase